MSKKKEAQGMVLCCEATGVKARFKSIEEKDLKPTMRFFANPQLREDHFRMEGQLMASFVHRNAIAVDHNENMREVQKDEEEFGALVKSIASMGNRPLHPLVMVRDFSKAPQSYRLVAGFRRWEALQSLGEEMILVRVVPAGYSDEQIQIAENLHRKNSDHLEIGATIARFRETNLADGKIHTEKSLCDVFSLSSQSQVHDYLTIHVGSDNLKKALKDGVLPFSKAALIASLPIERQDAEIEPARAMSTSELRKRVSEIKFALGITPPKGGKSPKPPKARAYAIGDAALCYRDMPTLITDLKALSEAAGPKAEEAMSLVAEAIEAKGLQDALSVYIAYERARVLQYATSVIGTLDNAPVALDFSEPSPDKVPAKPAEKKPAEKKPAEKKPAEKKPAEKKPAQQKKAEKAGVAPAKKKATAKKKAEEVPAKAKPEKPVTRKTPARPPSRTLKLSK